MIGSMNRRLFLYSSAAVPISMAVPGPLHAQRPAILPLVPNVELQPLIAQVQHLLGVTDYLGMPLALIDVATLRAAFQLADAHAAIERIQSVLDRYCLVGLQINPEMRVKVMAGAAESQLVENGWRQFLVKVHNQRGCAGRALTLSPIFVIVTGKPIRASRRSAMVPCRGRAMLVAEERLDQRRGVRGRKGQLTSTLAPFIADFSPNPMLSERGRAEKSA